MAVGTVGGTLHVHAGARLAQRLLGVTDAKTLAMIDRQRRPGLEPGGAARARHRGHPARPHGAAPQVAAAARARAGELGPCEGRPHVIRQIAARGTRARETAAPARADAGGRRQPADPLAGSAARARGPSSAPTRTARSSRAPTPRATRSRRASCRAELRPHLVALYAFARSADDFADEPEYEGRRIEALDRWEEALRPLLPRRGRPPGVRRAGRHHREARPARSRRSRTCWPRSAWTWTCGATRRFAGAARLHRALRRAGRAPAAGAVRLPRRRSWCATPTRCRPRCS